METDVVSSIMASKQKRVLSFKNFLENEFLLRCKKNPHYSLRAYANYLEIDHSTLSQMIRGKRKITVKMQQKLGFKLGLTPSDLKKFDPKSNYSEVDLDTFEVTSEWYYFAIMELLYTKSFYPDTLWVAQKLGLKESLVENALNRLVKIGFIEITEDGNWIDISDKNVSTLNHNLTSPAHIKMQKQLLEKAAEAMVKFNFESRSQTGVTMAIDVTKIPKAKEMIIKFQRELCAFLEDGEQSEVFHLGISLFPLSEQPI